METKDERNKIVVFSVKKPVIFTVIVLFCIMGCTAGKTDKQAGIDMKEIQIKGSDTIVNLVQAWAEEFSKENPKINIGITGGGSGTGFAALLNGTCDIAMASRSIEDKEKKQAEERKINPVQFTVGLDGLIVIVNPKNPVSKLTLSQIRDIFTANTVNWKDLSGKDSKIVILSRESNSGTHMFFKEHVLRGGNKKGKEEFSPKALLMSSSQTIVNEVAQNPHAVGYVGIGYINPGLKSIAVAKDAGSKYIKPSVENVMNNSYPISRPLYLYTDGEAKGSVKMFIDFTFSKEGQKIVKKVDFVPVKNIEGLRITD